MTKKWRNLPLRLGCATPYLSSTIENGCMQGYDLGVLDEANVLGVLTEAATAQVEAVLADDAVGVVAHAAATAQHATEVSTTRRNGSAPAGSHCPALLHSYGRCSGAAAHTPADPRRRRAHPSYPPPRCQWPLTPQACWYCASAAMFDSGRSPVAAAGRVVLRVGVVSVRHLRQGGCQGKQGARARREQHGANAN